jgi:glycine betaine/choline ABC-type transport system substrate-binding protein
VSAGRSLFCVLAAALALSGCGPRPSAAPQLVVGSTPYPESVLLAHVYAAALGYYGSPARTVSVPDPLDELDDSGSVSVVPGFTGRVLQRFQPGATPITDPVVYRTMIAALPAGLAAGDYTTAAENKPAAVVTAATARAWGGRELTALVRNCSQVVSGTVTRVDAPQILSGCKLPLPRQFPNDSTLFDALRTGQINVAWTTTADPGVPDDPDRYVMLADRLPPLVQAENIVPLYRRNQLTEQQVRAIDEVAGELDTATLVDMRRQVAAGADPGQVAGAWLAVHPLGR